MADTDQSGDPWAAEMAREVVGIVRAAGLEPSYDPGQFAVRYFTRPPAPPTRMESWRADPSCAASCDAPAVGRWRRPGSA